MQSLRLQRRGPKYLAFQVLAIVARESSVNDCCVGSLRVARFGRVERSIELSFQHVDFWLCLLLPWTLLDSLESKPGLVAAWQREDVHTANVVLFGMVTTWKHCIQGEASCHDVLPLIDPAFKAYPVNLPLFHVPSRHTHRRKRMNHGPPRDDHSQVAR